MDEPDHHANAMLAAPLTALPAPTRTQAWLGAGGDMAIDASENFAYFRVAREAAAKHLPPETKLEPAFGPRGMGAGPTGLTSMDLRTGETRHIISVTFQIRHVQTNPRVTGEIAFCWETGGKAPQRTWTFRSDGTGLRPLCPEAPYEWVTLEALITRYSLQVLSMLECVEVSSSIGSKGCSTPLAEAQE